VPFFSRLVHLLRAQHLLAVRGPHQVDQRGDEGRKQDDARSAGPRGADQAEAHQVGDRGEHQEDRARGDVRRSYGET
jgi:hypothetical protein